MKKSEFATELGNLERRIMALELLVLRLVEQSDRKACNVVGCNCEPPLLTLEERQLLLSAKLANVGHTVENSAFALAARRDAAGGAKR